MGVLVGTIASYCSDAGAIHLRHRISEAVVHYAIGSAGGEKKGGEGQLEGGDRNGYVFVFSTYRTWSNR